MAFGLNTYRAAGCVVTVIAAVGAFSALGGAGADVVDAGQAAPQAFVPGPDRPTLAVDFENRPTVDAQIQISNELPRRILAMYDSTETVEEEDDYGKTHHRPTDPEVALAHRLAELPLNHLGLVVDYYDVNVRPLPSSTQMKRYRGVLAWFADESMRAPDEYLMWLQRQGQAGRRVVVMERLGAFKDPSGKPASPALIAGAVAAAGGTYLGRWTDDGSVIAVEHLNPDIVGFERPLHARLSHYQQFRAKRGTAVHLRLRRTDLVKGASDAVWTGPGGGFALAGAVFSEDRMGERYVLRWILNPFAFFERAFGVVHWPRLDFTTRNGRRIFYSHIDGDGLDTLSEIERGTRCGAIIRDQVIQRYPLPFTASVVVGLTARPPLGRGSREDESIARSIFALDNVEVGSHGYAHPMDWRAGMVEGYSKADSAVPGLPGYPDNSDIVGRGRAEIRDSVEYINTHLAPPGKRCRIMLWTGWCNPTADQLAVAYELGLRNLNGGDPRMDAHYPSYAHMVAPVHQVGGYLQFLTSAANDYILTNEWQPPYYGFQNVVQTFERTGHPRRVVPVNVYFHFYIASKVSALRGLQTVMDWVQKQPLAPMFTGEYVDLVRDFHWARLSKVGRDWWVHKGGPLQTVRFDKPVHVDVAASEGVLGYVQNSDLGVTYVHLTRQPQARIRLTTRPPDTPYLVEASHSVGQLQITNEKIAFLTHGVGEREYVFGGLTPGTKYATSAEGAVFEVAGDGRLRLQLGLGSSMATRVQAKRVKG